MDQHLEKRAFDIVGEERELRTVADQVYILGKRLIEIIQHQEDQMAMERGSVQNEMALLKENHEKQAAELDRLRRDLSDAQGALVESHRLQDAMAEECRQLNESLALYRRDVESMESLIRTLSATKEENNRLMAQIDALRAEEQRLQRAHSDKLEELNLKFQQEKLKLLEGIQAAEDRCQNLQAQVNRHKDLQYQSEQERNHVLEELSKIKQDEKMKRQKINAQLAQVQAQMSELERISGDSQREQERKNLLALNKLNQEHREEMERLRWEGDNKDREISLLKYQIEQEKENHRRSLEAMKQEMENQLNIKADEIRRQFLIRSGGGSAATTEPPAQQQ